MYGEFEDDFLEMLHQEIGPKHPLYKREVYATAVRRDPFAVLYETVDGDIYAIVYFTGRSSRRGMPKTELFSDLRAVGEKIAADHTERLLEYRKMSES
jgi:hypothetical protein